MSANSYAVPRFNGKVALITGGASGIGRATAFRLAEEGASIIIADRNVEWGNKVMVKILESGGSGFFQKVDLADTESIKQMGSAVAKKVSALHVLVNCAGISVGGGDVETFGLEHWDLGTAVNLRAPALVVQALLPLMKRGCGAIVNISSDGGLRGRGGSWIYDATKAGLISLTKSMAVEFNPYGIRVNAVAPGMTVTEFHFGNHPDPEAKKKELENMQTDYCIMGRFGRPEEIAAAILFLASDDASYITGTTLCVMVGA